MLTAWRRLPAIVARVRFQRAIVAMAVGAGLLTLTASPASAAPKEQAVGSAQCSFTATLSFSPPLSAVGGGTGASSLGRTRLSRCATNTPGTSIRNGGLRASFAYSPLSCSPVSAPGAPLTGHIRWTGSLAGPPRAPLMASIISHGIATNSFEGNAVATVDVPPNFASLCATGKQITAVKVRGTLTVGATCGPGIAPFSIYPLVPGPLCGQQYEPKDITNGPDGALWFTAGGAVGRITTSGAIALYPVPSGGQSYGITAGPDGALWFTDLGPSGTEICRMTTAGTVTNCYSAQTGGFFALRTITSGPDGALWFTSAGGGGAIGRITTSGVVTYYGDSTIVPSEIINGPDGNLWFISLGDRGALGRITTAGVITTFPALEAESMTAGSDGNLWVIGGPSGDTFSRVTPSGTVTTVVVDPALSDWAITAGSDGALWFTGFALNPASNWPYPSVPIIGRVTTSGQVTSYTDPSLMGSFGITNGPDGALWFTDDQNDSIGRVATS
jgi:virginiamycin B lyase